jgi:hypothetical protein
MNPGYATGRASSNISGWIHTGVLAMAVSRDQPLAGTIDNANGMNITLVKINSKIIVLALHRSIKYFRFGVLEV